MAEATRYTAMGCGTQTTKLQPGFAFVISDGILFQGESITFTLPMEGLRLDKAGATGDTLRFTNPADPGMFISTTQLGILREPLLVSRAGLCVSINADRRKRAWCLGGCLLAVILAALLLLTLFLNRVAIIDALNLPDFGKAPATTSTSQCYF